MVQVNGKLRSHISCAVRHAGGRHLKARALEDPKVRPYIDGKQIVKVIVVPDKLVNIVVKAVQP